MPVGTGVSAGQTLVKTAYVNELWAEASYNSIFYGATDGRMSGPSGGVIPNLIDKGDESFIKVQEELKSGGSTIVIPMRGRLLGGARVGNQPLEGYEDQLPLYNHSMSIEEHRKGVRSSGRADAQRVEFDIDQADRDSIPPWWGANWDEKILVKLFGTKGSLSNEVSVESPMYYESSDELSSTELNWDSNGINSPSSGRVIYANNKVSAATLSQTDSVGMQDLERLITVATTASAATNGRRIEPVRAGGKRLLAAVIHPWMWLGLKNNYADSFYDLYKARLQGGDIDGNPLLAGNLPCIDLCGVTLCFIVTEKAPRFTYSAGVGSVASTAAIYPYTTVLGYGASGSHGVGRIALMGKHSMGMAMGRYSNTGSGRAGDTSRFKVTEMERDHGFVKAYGSWMNWGISKVRFNTTQGGATYLDNVFYLDAYMRTIQAA